MGLEGHKGDFAGSQQAQSEQDFLRQQGNLQVNQKYR